MIKLSHVSKSYVLKGIRKTILDDVSFKFPTDRSVAILGGNGAGKSTMLRLISGAELPDHGTIKKTKRISWPLGLSAGFSGDMTGLDSIRFISRVYGADIKAVAEYVRWFSELGSSLSLPVKVYSSGMKARLAFGLSMALDFDYYLVDEITAVGDKNFKKKCDRVFSKKLKNSNIIMVSHSMNTIQRYCDCGIILKGGRITYFDDISTLIQTYEALPEDKKRLKRSAA